MKPSKVKLDQRMLHTFCHFDKRLKSRYGFKITYSEYLKLCDTPILLLYKVSRHRRFGILNIRGKEVWVIKSNLTKKLVTCLSRKSYLPVPRTYRKNGITDHQFQYDVRSAIITCQTIKNYVIESKMTCEQMFLEKPFNMPSWVYSVVYSLITDRKNSHIVNNAVNILVMNLYEQKNYRKPKKYKIKTMCDSIRFIGGTEIQTVKEFQDFFKVDAKKYGWDGDENFINCCMCAIDLNQFFKDNPQYKFYYENGEWWEE